MKSPENIRLVKVVYDKNENKSTIHTDAHDFGSHTGDLQISRKVSPLQCPTTVPNYVYPWKPNSAKLK